MEPMPGEVAGPVDQVRQSHPDAESGLACFIYRQFQRLSAHSMRPEQPDHALQPSTFEEDQHSRRFSKEEAPSQDRAYPSLSLTFDAYSLVNTPGRRPQGELPGKRQNDPGSMGANQGDI